MNPHLNSKKGFTLVELIVAMSVFSFAVTLAVGAFVKSLRTQRTINHLMSVNSNTSLIIEQAAREIRTGYDFVVLEPSARCTNDNNMERGHSLQFTKPPRASAVVGNVVTYRWNEAEKAIEREECNGADCTASNYESLAGTNSAVGHLCFSVIKITEAPRITLFLGIGPKNKSTVESTLNIQTTVSSRILPTLDL